MLVATSLIVLFALILGTIGIVFGLFALIEVGKWLFTRVRRSQPIYYTAAKDIA